MTLTPDQETVINLLRTANLKKKVYWTGGTLLSYQYLNHRKSLDLDFFSDATLTFEELNDFMQEVKENIKKETLHFQKIYDRYEFILENGETLRVEFVHYNTTRKPVGQRGKLLGISIDSLEDIAANKVVALFDRNEPKDIYDLYFLIHKKGYTPQILLDLANKKFSLTLSEGSFYGETMKGLPLLETLKPLILEKNSKRKEKLLKNIKKYFKDESKKYLKSILR